MKNNWPTKKLSPMPGKETKSRLFVALDQLFKNDAFLFEGKVHERSISHKLAEYLQQELPGWHVDCEYNRHVMSAKKLPRECDGQHKEYVYPDIVVHHRGYDSNLLVIEIKLGKSDNVDKCDHEKLIEFTRTDGEYKYQLGLFIGFDGLNKPKIVWYETGQQKN